MLGEQVSDVLAARMGTELVFDCGENRRCKLCRLLHAEAERLEEQRNQ